MAKKKKRRSQPKKKSSNTTTIILIVLGVVGLVCVVGCIGVAALLLPAVSQARGAAMRTQSKNNLKQIGLAAHNFHDVNSNFPNDGLSPDGTPHGHGWSYAMLPYLEQAPLHNMIDASVTWDDPANQQAYQTVIPSLLNPAMLDQPMVGNYAANHYAGNVHIYGTDTNVRMRDIKDGTSNTVMTGEVSAGIKPWGDPTNTRDLANGLSGGPNNFGGPFKGGSNLLFCDGAVRFVSEEVDPGVLKALSTNDGGEAIGEF